MAAAVDGVTSAMSPMFPAIRRRHHSL